MTSRFSLVLFYLHASGLEAGNHCIKCYIFPENCGRKTSQPSVPCDAYPCARANLGGATNPSLRTQCVGVCIYRCVTCSATLCVRVHRRWNYTSSVRACVCVCARNTATVCWFQSHLLPASCWLPAVDSPLFHACCLSLPVQWLLCTEPSLAHKAGLIT